MRACRNQGILEEKTVPFGRRASALLAFSCRENIAPSLLPQRIVLSQCVPILAIYSIGQNASAKKGSTLQTTIVAERTRHASHGESCYGTTLRTRTVMTRVPGDLTSSSPHLAAMDRESFPPSMPTPQSSSAWGYFFIRSAQANDSQGRFRHNSVGKAEGGPWESAGWGWRKGLGEIWGAVVVEAANTIPQLSPYPFPLSRTPLSFSHA